MKHLPKSITTNLGHQDQEAKYLRSTQAPAPSTFPVNPDLAPPSEACSHNICTMLLPTTNFLNCTLTRLESSQRSPVVAITTFFFCNYDTNSINSTAIPNRQSARIRSAWKRTYKLLVRHKHQTKLHILHNKCSQDLKDTFQKYSVAFQRVPPKEHRVNSAECAICTFKNNIVAILL